MHSWTRTAAAAWGPYRIRVNAILPAIATPMYAEAQQRKTPEQLEVHRWVNLETIALGKEFGDPDRDLGPVMVFFASDASHFITGQLIPVDGGQVRCAEPLLAGFQAVTVAELVVSLLLWRDRTVTHRAAEIRGRQLPFDVRAPTGDRAGPRRAGRSRRAGARRCC